MPRTDQHGDRGGCALCSRQPGESDFLLECLACLREGHGAGEHAFCNGACFQRHWTSHRDRSLSGSSSYDEADAKAPSYHSTPTLRASSQPFTPANEKTNGYSQQHARGRPSPRMLQYPPVQSPTLPHLGGQGGAHPILATGPAFLRR